MGARIGIGISSFHRSEHLALCMKQIEKHTKGDDHLFIASNIPNIAKAKNECLYALKDCDHIFLFDDDTFVIKDNWIENFINSGEEHLLYLTERHNPFDESFDRTTKSYRDCGGCFMYIRKSVFDRVGYFNSEYKQYGFEHAGWSKRTGHHYKSLNNTKDYIYSLDYQGEGDWGVKHKPSITDYKAMQESIDYNRKVFEKEINSDKIYYDYTPENSI